MSAIKPKITIAEADQQIARAIEALKTSRVMIKGARPNWNACFEMLSTAQDLLREAYSPMLDARIDLYTGEQADV